MKAALQALLPKIGIDAHQVTIIPHQGVQDLESSLPRKLKAWRDPAARFLVLRDNDNGNCAARKQRLLNIINQTGRGQQCKVRIVCQQLESWFIGDRPALEASGLFPKLPKTFPVAAPDTVARPVDRLRRLKPDYTKIAGAQAIAPHLDIANCVSPSFGQTVDAIRQLIANEEY